jgi:prepilin-type N-terminal cleavage/methylation domain-containing protein
MLLSNARHTDQGFTLLETAIIVVIIGILSAIAAPSFLSMLNKNKVNYALDQVRGTLQEAQREAIRKSKSCTVTLDTTNNQVTTSSPCVVTGDRKLKDGVALQTNIPGQQITFGIRGNTSGAGKIVVFANDGSTLQKRCVVTSIGIGIMRTGDYSGSTASASDITAGTCTTSQ